MDPRWTLARTAEVQFRLQELRSWLIRKCGAMRSPGEALLGSWFVAPRAAPALGLRRDVEADLTCLVVAEQKRASLEVASVFFVRPPNHGQLARGRHHIGYDNRKPG